VGSIFGSLRDRNGEVQEGVLEKVIKMTAGIASFRIGLDLGYYSLSGQDWTKAFSPEGLFYLSFGGAVFYYLMEQNSEYFGSLLTFPGKVIQKFIKFFGYEISLSEKIKSIMSRYFYQAYGKTSSRVSPERVLGTFVLLPFISMTVWEFYAVALVSPDILHIDLTPVWEPWKQLFRGELPNVLLTTSFGYLFYSIGFSGLSDIRAGLPTTQMIGKQIKRKLSSLSSWMKRFSWFPQIKEFKTDTFENLKRRVESIKPDISKKFYDSYVLLQKIHEKYNFSLANSFAGSLLTGIMFVHVVFPAVASWDQPVVPLSSIEIPSQSSIPCLLTEDQFKRMIKTKDNTTQKLDPLRLAPTWVFQSSNKLGLPLMKEIKRFTTHPLISNHQTRYSCSVLNPSRRLHNRRK